MNAADILRSLLADPDPCPFCDYGQLRSPGGHAGYCPWAAAQTLLAMDLCEHDGCSLTRAEHSAHNPGHPFCYRVDPAPAHPGPVYAVTAGRCITRNGVPFVSLNACKDPKTGSANFPYVDADAFAHTIVAAVNWHGHATLGVITEQRALLAQYREALAAYVNRTKEGKRRAKLHAMGKAAGERLVLGECDDNARALLAKDGR